MLADFEVINETKHKIDDKLIRVWVSLMDDKQDLTIRRSVILHVGTNHLSIVWKHMLSGVVHRAALYRNYSDANPYHCSWTEKMRVNLQEGDAVTLEWRVDVS